MRFDHHLIADLVPASPSKDASLCRVCCCRRHCFFLLLFAVSDADLEDDDAALDFERDDAKLDDAPAISVS